MFHVSSLHWSLIIICIPDKEDESGPIILHLDSLGLHSSKSVFDNIKSYLIEEKNYMDREDMASDVSIADRIWKCLPRRIESQIIQKNDYDCGLFVLYFIERFMEEAPERLKMKDLDMFGRRWFKPQEASNLRVKIRKLLVEKLQNSVTDNCNLESSPSSSAGPATDCVETARDSLTGPATDCVETTEDSVT
uniref:Ubiquitin-like protease family profile domain-containing protein n=1 Tax=Glycine max TaxID=3847 RepID=A0A0R0J008_SOYBN